MGFMNAIAPADVVEIWSTVFAGWPPRKDMLMRITPLDVRKQEFRRGMRGYDADEVRAFLANLADEYEAVLVDNKQLRERLMEQDEKLDEYRNLEQTLRDTLMTAEKLAQEARETARKEGEVLLAEARQRVERVLAEGRERLSDLRREALAAHREKEAYLGRFRAFAEAQIQFVEQHRSDFRELDGRLLDRLDLQTGGGPSATLADEPAAAAAPGGGAPSPRPSRAHERDEWRDYAIEAGEEEQERIVEAVQRAEAVEAGAEAEAEAEAEARPLPHASAGEGGAAAPDERREEVRKETRDEASAGSPAEHTPRP